MAKREVPGWAGYRRSASATTLLFVLAVVALSGFLLLVWGATGSDDVTGTQEFRTWVGLCALTAGVWAVAFVAGRRHLATFRTAPDRVTRPEQLRLRWSLGAVAVLSCCILGLMLLLGGGDGFETTIDGWEVWRALIPLLGVVAAAPWVLATWWTHDRLGEIKQEIEGLDVADAAARTSVLRGLLGAWVGIERCTGALAAIVTFGTLTTGALRLAIKAGDVEEVPSPDAVLSYGLFFAVLVAVVVVPLLLAYRRRAREYLDEVLPPVDRPAQAEKAAALADQLHLSSGPLRDPWAVLGILTPVVTAALTAYLPGLQ